MAKELTATEKKLQAIAPFCQPSFESGETNLDTIAGAAFMAKVLDKTDIKFNELVPLIKQWGIDNGFIKTLEQRRDACREQIRAFDLSTIIAYADVENFVAQLVSDNDLPEKWCLDTLATIMEAEGFYVPEKSKLTDWQKALVIAFRKNGKLSPKECDEIIKEVGIQNYNHYTKLVHGLCYALMNDEVIVD